MDRRQFIAAGCLAAASPLLAQAATPGAAAYDAASLFKRVNFQSDGLALNPHEYISVLGEVAAGQDLKPGCYSNDGIVAQLEQHFAKLLGKEAAMFVPTGTLANHLAIRKLAGNDHRVLVQAESHFYNDCGDCAEILSGLNLIPLGAGRSTIDLAEVKSWVERSAGGRVESKVGVISIESPVRRRDHEFVDFAELERISHYAREQGIRLHLDGARMFNLPLHTGKSISDYAGLFDTVLVSLWKHFNGASGAMLAGSADFIKGLFHTRRMFGGSLPQAWPSVAVVSRYVDSYADDYAKSWQAADQLIALLRADGRFKVDKVVNGTSRFFITAPGITPELLTERLAKRGVDIGHPKPGTNLIAMQVNPSLLRERPARLARLFSDALSS